MENGYLGAVLLQCLEATLYCTRIKAHATGCYTYSDVPAPSKHNVVCAFGEWDAPGAFLFACAPLFHELNTKRGHIMVRLGQCAGPGVACRRPSSSATLRQKQQKGYA